MLFAADRLIPSFEDEVGSNNTVSFSAGRTMELLDVTPNASTLDKSWSMDDVGRTDSRGGD